LAGGQFGCGGFAFWQPGGGRVRSSSRSAGGERLVVDLRVASQGGGGARVRDVWGPGGDRGLALRLMALLYPQQGRVQTPSAAGRSGTLRPWFSNKRDHVPQVTAVP